MAKVIEEEQLFLAKIHNWEIKGEGKEDVQFTSFSDAFKTMQEGGF